MKNNLFLLLFLLLSGAGFSQSNYWNKLGFKSIPNGKERQNTPREYILMGLDLTAFKESIKNAPDRKTGNKNQKEIMTKFPDSKGKLSDYIVYEASIMHPDLQAKFPEIKSYVAYQVSDPSVHIRFSISPQFGLHGMVFSTEGISYIDSYSEDNTIYMIYDRKALPENSQKFTCETESDELLHELIHDSPALKAQNVTDGKMRIFRLALACTVEYSEYHIKKVGVENGTLNQKKAVVLAAINTTMTRVNGIYEKEVSLTMELVPKNDQLIFITSDSYTNDNGTAMLGENIKVCNEVIGVNNYDIGHVFSTGGGGIAYVKGSCDYNSKAGGVTGSSKPVGDPFDVDYVAHEMGHQYGANHTFNSTLGDCKDNRHSDTAVEPGSGSTIMAYAGICDTSNIQKNSDAYFHAVSLKEIYTHITTSGSCAAISSTGNNEPTANAGQDYVIPKSTAFVLTGSGSDPDGDVLTYCWEEIDTGTKANVPSSTDNSGPNFRSFSPVISPERYFPQLKSIISGNLTPAWEVIPSVARTLDYALTVRDNNPKGGQSARDDVKITVNADAGPFIVTSQASSEETWHIGSSVTISWSVAKTNSAPVNCKNVKITLSTDGGVTFPIVLAESTPNNGSAVVTVPAGIDTKSARIMVKAADNIFLAVNTKDFTISSQMKVEDSTVDPDDIVLYPNPSRGIVNLSLKTESEELSYKVYGFAGDLLVQGKINNISGSGKKTFQVDLTGLKTGSYILQINDGNEKIIRKILISR
ncbi:MAG: M12 family metallo-peptidase [Flavobacteriaceae bacterium]|nr:M12 family metallo-peptidase [Flavobacteriaceae bacterium]